MRHGDHFIWGFGEPHYEQDPLESGLSQFTLDHMVR